MLQMQKGHASGPFFLIAEVFSGSKRAEVVCSRLAGAAVGDDLKADLLALVQRGETGALNGADGKENGAAAPVRTPWSD